MNINDIAVTSLETITVFDPASGDYLFTIDELQSATISNSEEKEDITGKAGRKITSLKRSKSATISGTNGLVSGGLFEMQTGGKFKAEDKAEVLWTDYLTVNSNKATTSYKAIGTAGKEIESLFVKSTAGVVGYTLEQDTAAAKGKFAYDPTSKELSFSDLADGTEIVAVYKRNIKANVLVNESDTFSGKGTIYVDAIGEDTCANVYRIQFYFPKAEFNGEFEFQMGDGQAVHSFEAEALAGSCGAGSQLWTYTIFDSNTADAE